MPELHTANNTRNSIRLPLSTVIFKETAIIPARNSKMFHWNGMILNLVTFLTYGKYLAFCAFCNFSVSSIHGSKRVLECITKYKDRFCPCTKGDGNHRSPLALHWAYALV